jgi:hypothetical protein
MRGHAAERQAEARLVTDGPGSVGETKSDRGHDSGTATVRAWLQMRGAD